MTGAVHIVVAMKPCEGGFAGNALRHGVVGLNVDGCRVSGPKGSGVWGTSNKTINTDRKFNASPGMTDYRSERHGAGRWPANVVWDGSAMVLSAFDLAGDRPSGGGNKRQTKSSSFNASLGREQEIYGASVGGDTGSAARFFKKCGEFVE